ncbi:MAG: hypothetical protein H9W81_18470 [Enterococcus sp.]|nr:hypothetical protein [Enterococcus sp.]
MTHEIPTRHVPLVGLYGPTTVKATRDEDGVILIQELHEIPTPNNQTLEEWFSDVTATGFGLDKVRVTTTYSGSVVLIGFREADPQEAEQIKAYFPEHDEDGN